MGVDLWWICAGELDAHPVQLKTSHGLLVYIAYSRDLGKHTVLHGTLYNTYRVDIQVGMYLYPVYRFLQRCALDDIDHVYVGTYITTVCELSKRVSSDGRSTHTTY